MTWYCILKCDMNLTFVPNSETSFCVSVLPLPVFQKDSKLYFAKSSKTDKTVFFECLIEFLFVHFTCQLTPELGCCIHHETILKCEKTEDQVFWYQCFKFSGRLENSS